MSRPEEMSSADDRQYAPNARWSEVCARCHRFDFIGGLVSAVGFSCYVAVFFVPMTTDEDDQPEDCDKKLVKENNADGLNKYSVGGSGLRIAESMLVTMQVAGVVLAVLYVLYAILACGGRHLLKAYVAFIIFVICFLTSFVILFQTVIFPMGCFALASTIVVMFTMGSSALALFIAAYLWLAAIFLCPESRITWPARFGVARGQGEGQPLLSNEPV
ncbi:hypothetical protein V1264_009563 [Littorina saxatilis]|uniref:Uncharacterized protein n=1 Tax=Littorina saxatilis TaxID=31220 RepID=A0AAN9AS05_9CAEN